ncbi:MAG: hypothetical protein J3Q66DRAFT_91357 [Benniella sp.]|nr:MAG: hypothetical protein J3Q66DRAFT_91357 [Benniella sp.]
MPCCMNGPNKNFSHACMAWQALCDLEGDLEAHLSLAVLSFLHSTLFTSPQHLRAEQHSPLTTVLSPLHTIPHATPPETTLQDDSSNLPPMQSSSFVSGSYQRPGIDYYVNIFKDPPNVDELLASLRPLPNSLEALKPAGKLPVYKGLDISDLELGHDSTRERAFLAVLYLHDRLSLEEMELRIWYRGEPYNRLKAIANDIRYAEPMLRGLTPKVLLEYHQCVIKHYRALEEELQAGAYSNWMPTYFSKIARDLSVIEDNNGLIELTLLHKENKGLARKARKMEKAKKQMEKMAQTVQTVQTVETVQTIQTEQPQQLSKGRIDEVMVTIVFAMARNDHDVPIMVPALDWDRGKLFLAELEYEGEDKDEAPVIMRPMPAVTFWPIASRVRHFDNIFKDPPNVRELLARVRPPPVSVQAFKKVRQSLMTTTCQEKLKLIHLRLGDDAARERAFVAALYLRSRLCLGDQDLRIWCTSPRADLLDQIATEIRGAEPLLRGFSSDALVKHYERVITVYRAMEKELPGAYLYRREQTHFFKIARRLSIIEDNTGLLQFRKWGVELRIEKKLEKQREKTKKASMVLEQILDFHLATINNEAEWPVGQRKEKKKKKKKDIVLEQMLVLGAFNSQEEEQSDGVDDWLQTLPMTEGTEEKHGGRRKKKRKKEKKAMKELNKATELERILQVHANAKWNNEVEGANGVPQGILDPHVKTFHEMAVMADRHRMTPTRLCQQWSEARRRERGTNERTQVPEIHMNTINIKAEWPVDCSQAIPTMTEAKEKENEVPTIQSAPSKHHRHQLRALKLL